MLEELLDVIEEGTIAAQLGRGSSPSVHDKRPAGGSDGASLTERLAPSRLRISKPASKPGLWPTCRARNGGRLCAAASSARTSFATTQTATLISAQLGSGLLRVTARLCVGCRRSTTVTR